MFEIPKVNENSEKWSDLFQNIFKSDQWKVMDKFLKGDIVQYGEHLFNPKIELMWKSFELVNPDRLNCIIVGQDPYPQEEHCSGIPFGIPKESQTIPLSLMNIEAELNRMGNLSFINFDYTLESWCKQNVLLVNSSMTTLRGYQHTKRHIGYWQPIVSMMIDLAVYKNPGIPIICMGAVAKNTVKAYARQYSPVIEVPHPAKAKHDNVGLLGYKCFEYANMVLVEPAYHLNRRPILWSADLTNWPSDVVPTQGEYENPPF